MKNGIHVYRVTLRKRKNGYGEYEVKFINVYGRAEPELTYFTDDWDDALATARFERNAQGCFLEVNGDIDMISCK